MPDAIPVDIFQTKLPVPTPSPVTPDVTLDAGGLPVWPSTVTIYIGCDASKLRMKVYVNPFLHVIGLPELDVFLPATLYVLP